MDFGRLSDEEIDNIEFQLPAIHSLLSPINKSHLYLGCPIWSSDKFKGTLYPQRLSKSEYLRTYATQFDAIELNSTYHSIQSAETISHWAAEARLVNSEFKFCPKIPKLISHEGSIDKSFDPLSRFLKSIEHFEETLGTTFLQLSSHFSPMAFSQLVGFIQLWPQDFPLAVELRHPAWFKGEPLKKLLDFLYRHKISLVVTDTPGEQEVLHQHITAPHLLIRFVSSTLHPKDGARLNLWAQRLPVLMKAGVEKTYFFVHEPEESVYFQILSSFAQAISAYHSVRLPQDLNKPSAEQLSLF